MFAIWKACILVGIRPPGLKPSWDECGADLQALIMGFAQLHDYDEAEWEATLHGASPKGSRATPNEPTPRGKRKPTSRRKK